MVGRDSSVDTATRCGLDDPEIDSRWERAFQLRSRHSVGHNQLPIQCVVGYYWGKEAGAWR